jgi:DNA-binding response OmpR family regulator
MVGSLLELHGYGVRLAAGGAEALAALEREIPVLVLLDMRMRGTDGWAVAAAIRARGLVLPVVVMTAAQDARLWAEEIGADGYIAKPFHIDELLEVVRSHVRPPGN